MRTAFAQGNYITTRAPTDKTRSGHPIRSLSERLRGPPTPESQHTPTLREGTYRKLVDGYDTESSDSDDSGDRAYRVDSMSSMQRRQ